MSEFLSISNIKEKVLNKEASVVEVLEHFVGEIKSRNSSINAVVELNESAVKQAQEADKKLAAGEKLGALTGIPVLVKDLICTKGLKTTAASRILENFTPPYSATLVKNLEAAGAIVLGKTNLDEFAMGSSNENSNFGVAKNPWKLDCVPGGSSGGSAAAVAAGFSPLAIGTDTGGSIRQPASFCGVVGLKPTYGRVSRYGIVAFASSLDQAGPMTLNIADAALSLEAMAGWDQRDATSSKKETESWASQIKSSLKGKKVGLPKEFWGEEVSEDVRNSLMKLVDELKKNGVEIEEVSLPRLPHSIPVYYLINSSEASSNLARYDGVRYGKRAELDPKEKDLEKLYVESRSAGFGEEVQRRILMGTYSLSSGYYDAYYLKACQVRRLILNDFVEAFKKYDVLLSPVATTTAFGIGERVDNPLQMYQNDLCTTAVNLAGLPAISVPVGFDNGGLPVGAQFIAPHFAEQRLFDFGQFVEDSGLFEREVPHGLR